ncbi:MAG: hypothetical protein WBW76_00415 [Candidatus Cybelea sp.]
MRILARVRYLLSASSAAVILAGCGGAPQSQSAMPPIGTANRTQASERATVHGVLLYATGSDREYLYVMTSAAQTHPYDRWFSPPHLRGVCSDVLGNIYVTDFGSLLDGCRKIRTGNSFMQRIAAPDQLALTSWSKQLKAAANAGSGNGQSVEAAIKSINSQIDALGVSTP